MDGALALGGQGRAAAFRMPVTASLQDDLDALAEERDFSGVVVVSRDGVRLAELARGAADRANARPITLATPLAVASATKGLTALTIVSLIDFR